MPNEFKAKNGVITPVIQVSTGGTAGAPSISLTTDPNTGIYFPAADTIGFVEGGVEAMRIADNATISIAGTPPSATITSKLYVNSDITIAGSLRSITGNLYYDTVWKYTANGYGWGFRDDGAGKVQFLRAGNNTGGANATASVTLSDIITYDLVNNRVGIGTGSPGYKLEVNGAFAATTKSFLIDHPTRPDYKLRYGSLEGPENGVYVRGKTTTGIVVLPEYWTKLVDKESITVNISPIGKYQRLYVASIKNNIITIKNEEFFNSKINCYYTVFAERIDVKKLETEIRV